MARKNFALLLTGVVAVTLGCSRGNAADAAVQPPAKAVTGGTGTSAAPTAKAPHDSLTDAADRGRILGKESAPVWFIMVSDFQCPYCKAWHDSTFHILEKEYVQTGKIRMAFINYPLHANSAPAAITAMCAAAQGKFWGLHDKIFDTQDTWKVLKDARPYLDSLARAAGANAAELKTCEDSHRVEPLIEADQTRFQAAGVGGTPTFFIGGARMVGAQPPPQFRRVIDSVLAVTSKAK